MPDIAFVTEYNPASSDALELDYTYRNKTHRVVIANPYTNATNWIVSSDTLPDKIMDSFIRDAMSAIRGRCLALSQQLLARIREKRNDRREDTRTDCL